MLEYCAQLAAKIRALSPKVQWDPDLGRYRSP